MILVKNEFYTRCAYTHKGISLPVFHLIDTQLQNIIYDSVKDNAIGSIYQSIINHRPDAYHANQ